MRLIHSLSKDTSQTAIQIGMISPTVDPKRLCVTKPRNVSHRNRDRFQSWVCSSTSLHFHPVSPRHFLKSSHLPPSSPWWQPVLHAQRILACRVAKLVRPLFVFFYFSEKDPCSSKNLQWSSFDDFDVCANLKKSQERHNHQVRRNLRLLCGHFWPSFPLDQPGNSNVFRRVTSVLCNYVRMSSCHHGSSTPICMLHYTFTWFHLAVLRKCRLDQSSFSIGTELLPKWTRIHVT